VYKTIGLVDLRTIGEEETYCWAAHFTDYVIALLFPQFVSLTL